MLDINLSVTIFLLKKYNFYIAIQAKLCFVVFMEIIEKLQNNTQKQTIQLQDPRGLIFTI